MGLFYAYIKDANNEEYNRQLVTFATRETADEWWRMISTSPNHARCVKRIAPQFYVRNDTSYDLVNFFTDAGLPDGRQFSDKMFFGYVSHRAGVNPTTIPPTELTDHISGGWYFIRSKADQFSHWYLRTSGACVVCGDVDCNAVHVSSEYRTKFCVQVRKVAQVPKDFVMIGRDEISIVAPKDYTIHISDAGDLRATKGYQGETDLLFDDLKNRFITRAERQVNGEVWEYVDSVEKGSGEVWELVD